MADGFCATTTHRRNAAAGNFDIFPRYLIATADARRTVAARGRNGTTADGDRSKIAAGVLVAGADARPVAFSYDAAAVDGDRSAGSAISSADARRTVAASGRDLAAVDRDISTCTAGSTANTGSAACALSRYSNGIDYTAVDGDGTEVNPIC